MKNIVLILAGGKGQRFFSDAPKQFLKLQGKMIIEHTLEIFEKNKNVNEIYLVILKEYFRIGENLKEKYKKIKKIIIGGNTRQESSYLGIISIPYKNSYLLIHDAVRPLISERIINKLFELLPRYKAIDVAIPSSDTIIKINKNGFIDDIPPRKYYLRGQTPQAFHLNLIRKAHLLAKKDKFCEATDDCGLIKKYNLADIYVLEGDESNIKITYPIDLFLAEKYFQYKYEKFIFENKNFSFLKNKVIVIFGSSKGVGKEIFDIAKKYQAKVYGFSRSLNNVDISKVNDVKKALKNVYMIEKRIDSIIVTAAVLNYRLFNKKKKKEINEELKINILGNINVAKESFRYLKKSKGHLILFSSSSYLKGRANYVIYSASKAFVVNFVQGLSEEWENYKIKVNVICPDRIATSMRFDNFITEDKKKLLDPKDIALITLNLLNLDLSGSVIRVNNLFI